MKSAYNSIATDDNLLEDTKWRVVWDNKLPPRINYFFWLVRKGRLLTNDERVRRRMTIDASCARCGAVQETIMHVLRDCSAAKDVWRQQSIIIVVHGFFFFLKIGSNG